MEILALYYGIFCVIMVFGFLLARVRESGRHEWRLTPELALVASYFCYTSAMPVSRFFWGTAGEDLDIGFLQAHILGGLGLVCGLFIGQQLAPQLPRPRRSIPMTSLSPLRCVAFATAASLAMAGYVYYSVGLDFSNLFKPYGFEQSVIQGTSTFDTLLTPAAIATLLCCYNGALAHAPRKRWLRRLVLVLVLIVTVTFLVRGNRNVTLILWLPIAALAFAGRRLPILKTGIIALSAFVLYSAVAVTRNVGLAAADELPIGLDNMDPLHGELGTSYNVYSIHDSIASQSSLRYGGTYIVDFALNLVPRALWPNRPSSTAVKFSMAYYETDVLEFGLGYSPVVEAITNFSTAGILPVFALFSAAIVFLARYLRTKGRWGLLAYSMLLPVLVNWNRIDSNAAGKIFLVYLLFFVVVDILMYKAGGRLRSHRVRPGPSLHYAPVALAGSQVSGSERI